MRVPVADPGGQHLIHDAASELRIEHHHDPSCPLLVVATVPQTAFGASITTCPQGTASHAFPMSRELAKKLYDELGAALGKKPAGPGAGGGFQSGQVRSEMRRS